MDKDVRVSVILASSMEGRLVANIVEFEFEHQMSPFLHDRYEPTSRSTYLATIRSRSYDSEMFVCLVNIGCGLFCVVIMSLLLSLPILLLFTGTNSYEIEILQLMSFSLR